MGFPGRLSNKNKCGSRPARSMMHDVEISRDWGSSRDSLERAFTLTSLLRPDNPLSAIFSRLLQILPNSSTSLDQAGSPFDSHQRACIAETPPITSLLTHGSSPRGCTPRSNIDLDQLDRPDVVSPSYTYPSSCSHLHQSTYIKMGCKPTCRAGRSQYIQGRR